jgi:hypothetical protein
VPVVKQEDFSKQNRGLLNLIKRKLGGKALEKAAKKE